VIELTELRGCGVVVIGRNEGDRLKRCLKTLLMQAVEQIVYVDSGSTDGSIVLVNELGVDVVELDMTSTFTAARARNMGAEYIRAQYPEIEYIQFIDGDCEINNAWIRTAVNFLDGHREYAIACGRLRERFPESSIYNQLCDIEWDSPVGETLACGGITMIRVAAYQEMGGFKEDLIAGEEPELCFRLRTVGWKIRRLNAEMALHDAAMTRFGQWWQRAKRGGYAFMEGYSLHGHGPEQFRKKPVYSIFLWAVVFPLLIFFLSLLNSTFLWFVALYPAQIIRLMLKQYSRFGSYKVTFYYAFFMVLAKFPQLIGACKFLLNKLKGDVGTLIEHK
jgi:GT2 family glycosyltransferase